MRLALFFSVSAIAEVALDARVARLEPLLAQNADRALGKIEDLQAQLTKLQQRAAKLQKNFNNAKDADAAEKVKDELDRVERAARATEKKLKAEKRKAQTNEPLPASSSNLKDQVKERADKRDQQGDTDVLDEANETLKKGVKTAGDRAKKAVDGTVGGAKKAGARVKHEVRDAGDAMADEAVKAGESVKAGAVAVGNAAAEGALGVKNAAKHAKTNTKIIATNFGDAVGDKATDAKNAALGGVAMLGDQVKKAGRDVSLGAQKVGDAAHVSAVNIGDYIGDQATALKNALKGGLGGGLKKMDRSMPKLRAAMPDAPRSDLGMDWWKGLLAVLGTSAGIAGFAAIWELVGPAKAHAYEADAVQPQFTTPDGKTVGSQPATNAVTTITAPNAETVIEAADLSQTGLVSDRASVEVPVVEQAIPVAESTPIAEPIPVNAETSAADVQLLKERFDKE